MAKKSWRLFQLPKEKSSNEDALLPTGSAASEESKVAQFNLAQTLTDMTLESLLNTSIDVTNLLNKSTSLIYIFCFISSLASLSIRVFKNSEFNLIDLITSPWYLLYIVQLCFWSYSFIVLTVSSSPLCSSLSVSLVFSFFFFSFYISTLIYNLGLTCISFMGYSHLSKEFSWTLQNLLDAECSLFDCVLMLSFPFLVLLFRLLSDTEKSRTNFLNVVSPELKGLTDKASEVLSASVFHSNQLIHTLATELEDVASLAIQIVRELSPPELLIKPQEHVSACSIPIPTATVSAIHFSLRQIASLSSRLEIISGLIIEDEKINTGLEKFLSDKTEFEIGDLMQSVGDILAGAAAEANVELVLCHGDCRFHNLNVLGNEEALRRVLIASIRNLISSAEVGTTIELGLQSLSRYEDSEMTVTNPSIIARHCSIEIVYTPSVSSLDLCSGDLFAKKLIKELGGEFEIKNHEKVRVGRLSFRLPVSHLNFENGKEDKYDIEDCKGQLKISEGPSEDELAAFSNTLRGLKIALHAKNYSTFAKHLTSCLTLRGTDITHISIDSPVEPQHTALHVPAMRELHTFGPNRMNIKRLSSADVSNDTSDISLPSFIIIDDDVNTLREQFTSLRNDPAFNFSAHQHGIYKRMELLKNHMVTSIIHFTSLSKYQQTKDEVYSLLMMPHRLLPPHVLVIPKPIGPKRLLAALYTATTKPKINSFYAPIATSPISPGTRYSHSSEEEKNPMDITNFDPYPLPTDSSADSIVLSTPDSVIATPIAGTIIFDPKQFGSNREKSTVSTFPQATSYLNYKSSEQNHQSSHLLTGTLSTNGHHTTVSPIINAKPMPLSHIRPEVTPLRSISMTSSPIPGTISPSAPLSSPLPTQSKNKAKNGQKKKSSRPPNGTSRSTSALTKVVSPPINVLIVEDNPINQTILSTFMRKRKIKYSVANNGLEAVEKWKEGGLHLVLMDIQLPVMDGIEATKKIRSIEKTKKIGILGSSGPSTPVCSPVIILALTASSLEYDRHAALAAGCNDFLTKPVSLIWLEKKIMEWGCMQALIDFEGWRKWKSQDLISSPAGTSNRAPNIMKKVGEAPINSELILTVPSTAEISKKSSVEALSNLKLPAHIMHGKSKNWTRTDTSDVCQEYEPIQDIFALDVTREPSNSHMPNATIEQR